MSKQGSEGLFNTISPLYGLFFNRQRQRFAKIIRDSAGRLDLTDFTSILDVGCGTGALCSVLDDLGLDVTGIEPADKMLAVAKARNKDRPVRLLKGNVLASLPFEDKSFDCSIASYVAHGLIPDERKRMFREMGRVSRKRVIIHDYNRNRSPLISLVEWLERGDYFNFIRQAEKEMKNCVTELSECFSKVEVIDVDVRAAWYICTPK